MFKSYILLVAALCASVVLAAPITGNRATSASALSKRGNRHHRNNNSNDNSDETFHGRGTWFSDDSGSCDIDFDQDDMIVAMNEEQMGALQGPSSQCGRMVRVHYGGKSVDLKVVDTCPSQYCDEGALDLSQKAFKMLAGGLSKGVISLDWEFIEKQ
ncbi:hypothetical protein EMPS_11568 [Entomortierella parvispora]|uniref:RlpA-like protein double-psi beta-barrel domain-containing protein n=1 Tax=Entomortierella parvispora TaxID=205924 RepID=A0A9P3M2A5_9FUNG|nr:hypothetical protein EMPS_11568 [Entomortierella parvispora]